VKQRIWTLEDSSGAAVRESKESESCSREGWGRAEVQEETTVLKGSKDSEDAMVSSLVRAGG